MLRVAEMHKFANILEMQKAFPSRPTSSSDSQQSYAIVASEFNGEFVQALVDNAIQELQAIELGANVVTLRTPGSFEIPLFVQKALETDRFQAIIALGVIIEGETAHAMLIAETVTRSLMDLSLKHQTPVVHEVLLVKNEAQAKARCFDSEHNRGVEAARAAISAARNLKQII